MISMNDWAGLTAPVEMEDIRLDLFYIESDKAPEQMVLNLSFSNLLGPLLELMCLMLCMNSSLVGVCLNNGIIR